MSELVTVTDYEMFIIKMLIPIMIAILASVVIWIILKTQPRRNKSLHKRYLLQMIRLLIIVGCLVHIMTIIEPTLQVRKIFLQGSALVVAIVGFAAQPAISDLICGLLISINKPFEIGDRIIIEGLEPGIVEDITLRHTVLRIYDDQRIIVPNSELNSKTVTNASYKGKHRQGACGVHRDQRDPLLNLSFSETAIDVPIFSL